VALLAFGSVIPLVSGPMPDSDLLQTVSRVNSAEFERESTVGKVICTRRYTLRNKHWDQNGIMNVRIISNTRTGEKQYEILSMTAEGLQKKVFLKLLEAEVESSESDKGEGDASITSANYDFALAGTQMMNGKEYVVVHLKPKRKSKFLLAGKAWIDPAENAIVKVEGQTARSLSFWIGKPQITQSFRKVDGVWVSATNQSVSDVRLLGRTELDIEFSDYKIVRDSRVARASVRPGF